MKAATIGEFAARCGVSAKTVRYYESIDLLPAPPRSEGGYRLYGSEDEERLAFIRKAKRLGLSLDEIGGVLSLHDAGVRPCDHVIALLEGHITRVDEALAELGELRRQLAALRADARRRRREGDGRVCRIIEHAAIDTTRWRRGRWPAGALREVPAERDLRVRGQGRPHPLRGL